MSGVQVPPPLPEPKPFEKWVETHHRGSVRARSASGTMFPRQKQMHRLVCRAPLVSLFGLLLRFAPPWPAVTFSKGGLALALRGRRAVLAEFPIAALCSRFKAVKQPGRQT